MARNWQGLEWRDEALCADGKYVPNPDDWYRIGEDRVFEQRHLAWLQSVCDQCPVKASCLEYAIANEPDWGVFAGTTPRMRAKLRRGVA